MSELINGSAGFEPRKSYSRAQWQALCPSASHRGGSDSPKSHSSCTLTTAPPSVQLHHRAASSGMRINESVLRGESGRLSRFTSWVSTFLLKLSSQGVEQGQLQGQSQEGLRTAPPGTGSCPGTVLCCSHPHSALLLFQIGQEWGGRMWRVFLEFLIQDSCCLAREAHSLWRNLL